MSPIRVEQATPEEAQWWDRSKPRGTGSGKKSKSRLAAEEAMRTVSEGEVAAVRLTGRENTFGRASSIADMVRKMGRALGMVVHASIDWQWGEEKTTTVVVGKKD